MIRPIWKLCVIVLTVRPPGHDRPLALETVNPDELRQLREETPLDEHEE
jgi:hypothetical protein